VTAVRFLVHNWPLKLAALALAVLLYGGLVLSERSRLFEGSVPIDGLGQSADVVLLSDLGVVRQVRYFASEDLGLRLDASSFRATVDLSGADPGAGPLSLAIHVEATDPRVQVLEFEPRRVNVTLDRVVAKVVPIEVDRGVVPLGLDVREPVVSASEATVRGPETVVRRVAAAIATVRIDPSGLDVNREVELVPVDAVGEPLSPIDVEPAAVRVRIAVFTDRQTRSLAVNPVVTGTPAAGWEIAGVELTPLVVTVEGDADEIAPLVALDTLPVSIAGATADVVATVGFELPDGVLPLGSGTAEVTIRLRQVTATRTLEVGLALIGARSDRTYDLASDRVLLTFGGSVADLDRIDGATLVATLDVTNLAPGTYELEPSVALPTGVSLVARSPELVSLTIGSAGPSPSPSPVP